jgi:8-oxo-dGTP pyrophosphatase MutT (NUDIX family)
MGARPPVHRLREVRAYGNSFVDVFDDEVEFANGIRGRYLRIVHAGGSHAGVVLLAVHGEFVALVRTYRYPAGAWEWGLPRGFASDTDPLATARAELREEVGVTARELRPIGSFTPDSGLLASRVTVMLAMVDHMSGRPEDELEVAEVRWVRTADLWAMAADGRIEDGITLAALTLAQANGALPPAADLTS